MSLAFQFLDIAVVAVILVSAVYATYRGFVSESLSILGWLAAAFATLYFGPWAAYWMRGMVSPAWLGMLAGYGVVFLAVVIPATFASHRISENVKKSSVGALDGTMGAAFGVVRGFAIVGIAYLIFTAFVPIGSQPGWITRARLLPVIRMSAQVVASLVPDQHVGKRGYEADAAPEARKAPQKPVTSRKTADSAPSAAKPEHKKHRKKTYGAKDRHALDRLIEATGSDVSGKP
ncbi:MAG: CvpA family protein [Alphaproteobacteria bacterium]|nr:CvpA family protein [Alphaproteobacteria bacterium]